MSLIAQFVRFERTLQEKKKEVDARNKFQLPGGKYDAKSIDACFARLKVLAVERQSILTELSRLHAGKSANIFLGQKVADAFARQVISANDFTEIA